MSEGFENSGTNEYVTRILDEKLSPAFEGMRQRVAEALIEEFNSRDADWATDSVIKAVFGFDYYPIGS